MAKVTANQLIAALNGAIGGLVFRQMPDGSVVVSTAPQYGGKRRKSSKKQKLHQRRFKQATAYARLAAKIHPIYTELAKGTVKSAYNFALSDWFHAPVIHQLQCKESKILIQVTDDIVVTKVQVTLSDENEKILEKGEASRSEGDWWEFIFSTAGKKITVEAYDLPGHRTIKDFAASVEVDPRDAYL